MKIAIPRERMPEETRVAAVPETVAKLVKAGLRVSVEAGAGLKARFADADYGAAGAEIVSDLKALYASADAVFKVQRPLAGGDPDELGLLRSGQILVALLWPLNDPELAAQLAARGVTAFAMDLVPRIARAQKLDALSSQSSIAGYKAVLLGANALGKMMPMLMTAAGTILPAKVFVIGAGVAGLQAIATAKRLGAVVEAFDTRPVVKEQVESLGAKFVKLDLGPAAEDARGYARELTAEERDKQNALVASHAAAADLVITTALIPGKPAPRILTAATVRAMRRGSVIVDLASDAGGNCELTEPGQDIERDGVRIIGVRNVPGLVATQASQLYARNVMDFFLEMAKKDKFEIDLTNPVLKESLVTRDGAIVNDLVRSRQKGSPSARPA